jgi:hypothetical protein
VVAATLWDVTSTLPVLLGAARSRSPDTVQAVSESAALFPHFETVAWPAHLPQLWVLPLFMTGVITGPQSLLVTTSVMECMGAEPVFSFQQIWVAS